MWVPPVQRQYVPCINNRLRARFIKGRIGRCLERERGKMNSMNHVSGSLHLEGTVLHTVIMNVLHAEFHQEMLKRRKELRNSS